jgi:outer membrane protein assembly factor BamB
MDMLCTRTLFAVLVLSWVVAWPGPCGADDWPQWLGPKRDGVWRETGIVEKFPQGGPKELWRKALGGGYAGPAVAGGKVFVMDRVLDPGERDSANPFDRSNSKSKERVTCFDARTGKQHWQHVYPCVYKGVMYPCGPRTTPVIHDGKVYTLGAMGDLYCLDVATGKPVWSKNLMKDYSARVPLWGFSANPLLDGDNLIVLVGRNPVVVALDRNTGKEKWRALELERAEIGYCPPMIFTFGGQRQLIVWHPEAVHGLDPATGKPLWSHEWEVRSNLTISTPRQVGNKLFLTSFYNGCRLLEVTGGDKPAARLLYKSNGRGEQPRQTDKLHSIMVTPVIKDEHIYGVCSYGELRCLRLSDGKRLWEDLTATGTGKKHERWANAFIVPHGDRYFLFNEKGDLVIAKLSPGGYEEVDRAHLLDPTGQLGGGFSAPRKVLWSHPAFAGKCIFVRNDREIACFSLAAAGEPAPVKGSR